jgi:protein involved in polysaccharide export with SLBB domain
MVVLKKVEYDLFKIKGSVLRTVRQSFNSFPMIVRRVIPGFLWFIAGIGVSFAQIATPPPGPAKQDAYDRTKAVPVEQSRAQQEADSLVSLSADKIVALLTDEPGLFLECSKVLVRTAFAQGRVLRPEDLTEDAIFRQVREDVNVRILFTREIEDRYYVRAKPTQEELERDYRNGRTRLPDPSLIQQTGQADLKSARNDEERYWLRHERDLDRRVLPAGTIPNSSIAAAAMAQSPQQNPSGLLDDQQRALLQMQSPESFYDGFGERQGAPDGAGDQMPALLSTQMSAGGLGGGLSGDGANSGVGQNVDNGAMGSLMGGGIGMPGFDSASGLSGSGLGQDFYGFNNPPQMSQQANLSANGSNNYPLYGYSYRRPMHHDEKQPALRHRPNPYADIPSLYDLYAQYPRRSPKLDRFGMQVFQSGTGNFDKLPMDMPVGTDYVLGPGDGVSISLFGGISQRIRRVVDREGRLSLPEVGGVEVAGKTLGDVQQLVQSVLRTEYRDIQADVSIARLRSVRVYVVGDAESPGAYDVSSLSTPLNAVFEAGGPTSGGSLRIIEHYRGKQLLQKVDVYDLLLHGVNGDVQRLEAGDTIKVPPLGPEVTVQGMVRRPAVYELNGEMSLAQVLEIAGGVLPTGTLRHVDVERLEAHTEKTMLRLDIPESNNAADVTKALQDFQIQDGDKIQISPIVPYADKTVYLDGYVFHPGKFAYRDGMRVTDLVATYRDILPEPYKQHAEIIRLKSPDNTPEVLAFNLGDALDGKDQDLVLQPFDTVRIFGRFDFEDPPVVTVTGEVRDPGDHVTNGVAHLRDAIYLAGNVTADAQLDDVQIFRKTQDGMLRVISVNLGNALQGDAKDDIVLEPRDRIIVHKSLAKLDPATVTIEGEVARPGKYPLGHDMTAASLVQFAGGLTRGAYSAEADLTSYMVQDGKKVVSDHTTVQIAKALEGDPDTDVRLHDGDVLTIRQLAGWNDLGATITVKGEVMHPGTYGIQEGERLSSIIQRAGGFRADSYPYAAVFQRVQVRELQEQNRSDLIRRVKGEEGELKAEVGADEELKQAALVQYETTLEKLENTPPPGRLVVHISKDVKRWANTSVDVQVRAGDEIFIPKRSNMVIVDGAVYNPTGLTFKPGKSAGWYLSQAGGPTQLANRKAVFVVRGDGSVVGGSGGLFSGGVDKAILQPGDMVVVPERPIAISRKLQNTVMAAQILTALGVAAQAAFYIHP